MNDQAVGKLALFGALGITFDLFHEALDQWFQPNWAAIHKRKFGTQLVYRDGIAVGEEDEDRSGWETMTVTQLGQRACSCHVAIYTVGQIIATIAITKQAGYRISPLAVLAGAGINAATHWPLDRGPLLRWLAKATGKTEYLSSLTVVRKPDAEPHMYGAGTAWNELDRSAHRALGWFATAVTVGLATRRSTTNNRRPR